MAGCPGSETDAADASVTTPEAGLDASDASDASSVPPVDASANDAAVFDANVADAATDATPTRLRVLFVGNSYTYVNDLPAVIAALDEATPGVTL